MSTLLRRSLATAGLAGLLATGAVAAPTAQAGGDGHVYVYGSTLNQCRTNLDKTILTYKHQGYTVTGVQGCRLTGAGDRYFGYFYA